LGLVRIFMLEDDEQFAVTIAERLRACTYEVSVFHHPHALFYELTKGSPTLVIVDWMLPEMTGLDVVKRLRQTVGTGIAIMMLTQMDSEEHIVGALEAGADDYVVKPGAGNELTARVKAVLRRYSPAKEAVLEISSGPYVLDFRTQSAAIDGRKAELAPREFDLVWTFFSSPGRLFSKSELLAAIWGRQADPTEHTITQHIYSVRKKLSLAEHGFRLTSVYGTGYRLEQPSEV
jgi:two-component system, OmpR family, phosphate regulon response regulator PhoB